ncbi:MAG: Slp family lipoprotein [Nitrospirales bacterium]
MQKLRTASFLLLATTLLQACSSSPANIPETLENQIDQNLNFSQVIQDPDIYQGQIILLGGVVLKAQRLQNGTQIEILQLPLDEWQRPTTQRTTSKGRFLALQREFLDPATLPPDTPVTIVAKITGSKLASFDETEYRYPTLFIEHLHLWENDPYQSGNQAQPRWSIFGGGSTGGRVGGGVGIGIGF